jgi:hypothetical protein
MIKLPTTVADNPLPTARMSLVEYAAFSDRCRRSNRRLTAADCLKKRADEARMVTAFHFPATAPHATECGHGR